MGKMKPSLVLNRASSTSAFVAIVQFPVLCKATSKEMDGCENASECVNEYWRFIWVLITVATIIYFLLVAWNCWISSKLTSNFIHCTKVSHCVTE